jgi:hypothetical protein
MVAYIIDGAIAGPQVVEFDGDTLSQARKDDLYAVAYALEVLRARCVSLNNLVSSKRCSSFASASENTNMIAARFEQRNQMPSQCSCASCHQYRSHAYLLASNL